MDPLGLDPVVVTGAKAEAQLAQVLVAAGVAVAEWRGLAEEVGDGLDGTDVAGEASSVHEVVLLLEFGRARAKDPDPALAFRGHTSAVEGDAESSEKVGLLAVEPLQVVGGGQPGSEAEDDQCGPRRRTEPDRAGDREVSDVAAAAERAARASRGVAPPTLVLEDAGGGAGELEGHAAGAHHGGEVADLEESSLGAGERGALVLKQAGADPESGVVARGEDAPLERANRSELSMCAGRRDDRDRGEESGSQGTGIDLPQASDYRSDAGPCRRIGVPCGNGAGVMRSWALVAAIAGLAGCAVGGHSAGPDPLAMQDAAPSDGAVLLHVDNRNWQDIEVYAVNRGARMRVGIVSSMTAGDFKLSTISAAGGYQLLVAPVGDSRGYFVTNSIPLAAGQTLDLRVENNLNLTTYTIY